MKARRPHREREAVTYGGLDYTKLGASSVGWNDLYRLALSLGWRPFFAGLFAAEIVINLCFAGLYSLHPGCIANARPGSFTDLFFFSIETLATVGYGVMAPDDLYGHVVSAIEIITGLTFTAVTTGLIFIRFSKPRPRLLFSNVAVIGDMDGQKTLTIRIGNGHTTALSDLRATLTLLLLDHDSRGSPRRRIMDVKLERALLPFFPLTWNLMHRIVPDSPFHDLTDEMLRTADAKLILTLHAHDPAIASDVRANYSYGFAAILLDHRFQDAVTVDESGHTTADLTRLSLVERL